MKKIHLLVAVALVAIGMASCSQDDKDINGGSGTNGTGGEVRLTLGFAGKKAVSRNPSTAKPTTSWEKNIKDLMVLFVDSTTSKVCDSRKIPREMYASNNGMEQIIALSNIKMPEDGHKVSAYVIANSQDMDNKMTSWDENSIIGYPIADYLMKLVSEPSDFVTTGKDPIGSTIYRQPAEVFVGTALKVNIDGTSTPLKLTRIISLLRVRIDKRNGINKDISFTDPAACFRIRRATTSVNPLDAITRGAQTDVLYTSGGFNTTNPTDGYDGGIILDTNFKLWQDIKMFRGGSGLTGPDKFDFVLIGKAPVGYVPLGKTTGLQAPSNVAWSAAVSKQIYSNQILEINLTLNRAGVWIDDPNSPNPGEIPEVGQYANVEMNVTLEDWGAILSEDIPV